MRARIEEMPASSSSSSFEIKLIESPLVSSPSICCDLKFDNNVGFTSSACFGFDSFSLETVPLAELDWIGNIGLRICSNKGIEERFYSQH